MNQPVNPIALRVIVSGRVQGVFFRGSTQQQAAALGVTGWVRNLPDGDVEAWLEAPEPIMEDMISWIKSGPDQAIVDHIEVESVAVEGFAVFEVRR